MPSSSTENLVDVTSSIDRSGWLFSVTIEKRGKRAYRFEGILSSGDGGKLCKLLVVDCDCGMFSSYRLDGSELLVIDRSRISSSEDVLGYGVRGGRMK